ncbi:hypothetical protein [Streptomyces tanashiensis]|uniref:FXSXX-COOH protein n=1 Tax=Streptomyces tanashiensis TaxID=67367 RepID=A0ABY6QZ18_9ACTN|nr:hypothetical protein [Streptomyces tanashiensis]UZX21719.1 hypothetical protein LDH80_13750 [Streptomyces tanashiensis]GGY02146.1 hypothetical protein GCM10010299_01000 [Streptomyces tanashiensis]
MLEHTKRVAGVGRGGERPRRLPDLTTVDLRTLRFMDDPELAAAVERVLWHPQELAESWTEGAGTEVHG